MIRRKTLQILKNDNAILNIIKYGPILFVLISSLIITFWFINHQNNLFKKQVHTTTSFYLEEQKKRVKSEVNRFIKTIKKEKKDIELIIKKEIQQQVYQAHKLATQIYEDNLNKKYGNYLYDSTNTLNKIKSSLSTISFNDGRGYIFIDHISGRKVLHPIKSLEGKNLLEFKDSKGYQFVKTIVSTIKNKTETFDTYYWYKGTDTSKSYKKIGFYKSFDELKIAIGSGEYKDDAIKELQYRLLDRIRNVKIGKNGYIFIANTNGLVLSHLNKKIIGTNQLNKKNKNGEYLLRELITFAKKNKEGFITYSPPLTPKNLISNKEKVSYITLFKEWNWVIGTGFYMEELNQTINKKKEILEKSNMQALQNIIIISIAITIILILLSFFISNIIKIRFQEYKANIEKEIEKTIEKEKLLIQQSKMATMGEMLGSIAHQWKQPLSLLSMSNGIIRMDREEEGLFDKKQIDTAVDNIDVAINNINHTIDDFRNFFNPNKERSLFNINDAFNETFKLTSSQFKQNNIEVISYIDNIELFGSQNELQQTLINFLKNAKEELVKKESNQRRLLFISAYQENEKTIIKIKDNANGIPINIIDKVFDSYFTTKAKEGGSGIGLYMSKQIIEGNMKGSIHVINSNYSYEDVNYIGAEFIIEIPLDLRGHDRD